MKNTTRLSEVSVTSPVVSIVNNHARTTSQEVARVFEKQHLNVLRSIKNLCEEISNDFDKLNFEYIEIIEENANGMKINKSYYEITKDGFVLLAMGFTGKKAMQFKLAYIEAFNAKEAELARQAAGTTLPAKARSQHLSPSQVRKIQKKIAERVYQCTPHGSEFSRRDVFASFHRGLKDTFRVPSYTMIPSDKFEMAIAYLDMTGPTLVTPGPAPAPIPFNENALIDKVTNGVVEALLDVIKRMPPETTVPIDEAALAIRITNEIMKQLPAEITERYLPDLTWTKVTTIRPQIPTENGILVTDFGLYHERPWKTARKLHPELYASLEAKYVELGKDKHRGVEALRNSMFYETEEFGVMMDYMIHKMPRFLENILKLQLAALGHGLVFEEIGKLSEPKKHPLPRPVKE